MLDIYDENMNFLGSMERKKAHRTGALHRTFHCWFVSKTSVFFQLRGENVGFPNFLDVTVGGHLRAGELVQDTYREIGEEVGLTIDDDEIFPVGSRLIKYDTEEFHIREFALVFMVPFTDDLDTFNPNPEELGGVVSIPFLSGKRVLRGQDVNLTVDGIFTGVQDRKRDRMTISRDTFVPGDQEYFLRIFQASELFARGKRGLLL